MFVQFPLSNSPTSIMESHHFLRPSSFHNIGPYVKDELERECGIPNTGDKQEINIEKTTQTAGGFEGSCKPSPMGSRGEAPGKFCKYRCPKRLNMAFSDSSVTLLWCKKIVLS